MIDQVLSMLGLAKKAGRLEIGEEPVGAAVRARRARVLLVAWDAGPSSQRRAFAFAEVGGCLCLTIPADRDSLGWALGRTSVAMCAVTDIGFADAIVKKLAVMDPERYGPAAAQLDIKAQRAMERRAEQLRHEKNLRQGKHRVHDAPPPPPPVYPEHPPAQRTPAQRAPAQRMPAQRAPAQQKAAPRPQQEMPRRGGAAPTPSGGRGGRSSAPPADRFAGSLPVQKGKGSRKPGGHK